MHDRPPVRPKLDLLRRVGNVAQLGGTRHCVLSDGPAAGLPAIDVDTGAGLQFTVLPGRGMDIGRCSFKGTNLVYLGPAGETHAAHYDPAGAGWLRSFSAGLLTTCGLAHFGPPHEEHGLHGRISNTPARLVSDLSGFVGDEYEIVLRGTVEEAVIFGHKLRLERTIRTRIGATSLAIEDAVTNFGFRPAPLLLLYHINLGYPLVDGGASIVVNSDDAEPRDEAARRALADRLAVSDPDPDFAEQVFHYRFGARQTALAAVANRRLHAGLGLFVEWDARELPVLNNWRMFGCGDYVVGLEPANAPVWHRTKLAERGLIPSIQPQETRRFRLEIGVLDGVPAIDEFASRA